MGADQNRIILPRQSLQEKLKILSRTRIQTGIRFIQHQKLRLSEQLAHIGGFEMDRCQRLIDLCEKERNKETA